MPLVPGFELDFEYNQVRDSGNWLLPLTPLQQTSFVSTRLGMGLQLPISQFFAYTSGFASRVSQAPGHSFSFWFMAGATPDTLIDFFHDCGIVAAADCGVRVLYRPGALTVVAGNGVQGGPPFLRTLSVGSGMHSVVVTEQKAADGSTRSLSIYIDGSITVMSIGSGNVYGTPSDTVLLPSTAGTVIDEYEFWPRDLSLDPETLCENGWDGEWDPVTTSCVLTSN